MKITKLKGGSLSSTSLIETDNFKFIRKSVSLKDNREYGFVRWYSQLKKLQKYNSDFPRMFPRVIGVSYDGEEAYFDLEFMEGYENINTILLNKELTDHQIQKISIALWNNFKIMHRHNYEPNVGSPLLYFKEEVEQKILDARKYPAFDEFFKYETYEFNGKIVHGITNFLYDLKNFFGDMKLTSEECIHGNPTLENTLYSFVDDAVVFVDPYEESIIDTKFLDYSMVLQSSNSLYEYFNEKNIHVEESKVWCDDIETPSNFNKFNDYFLQNINDDKQRNIIGILEATQFIRMLPFKCAVGDFDHAKYFYLHACNLLNGLLK